ncbi:NYN domain-containing protein [Pseudotabrizicola alkalilacus]|uniref:NYN domain-containing protein n=1 Tax=Pseudotabrizicola alkalilacus TaxID=2305252 RepID=UPI001F215122|nr:NYN domain-containing protein [Pseudotabrizicola alkalilacus]
MDAGYLYAQGSSLLSGQKQPRQTIQLSTPDVLKALCEMAERVAPGARLLRVYWYDGLLRGGRPTTEQITLANSQRTKLRLGMVNGSGQQKGVDSLIVTDLIDLARNKAITDALLVAGDEDLRIGVQIAQTFGVQTHLLGIKPARGSQSPDLIQEADTHHEWLEADIARFMTVTLGASAAVATEAPPLAQGASATPEGASEALQVYSEALVLLEIQTTIATIGTEALELYLEAFRADPKSVPSDLDRQTLGRIGAKVGAKLEPTEVREYRRLFRERLLKECDK